MDKKLSKNELVRLAERIHSGDQIAVAQVQNFLDYQFHEISKTSKFML